MNIILDLSKALIWVLGKSSENIQTLPHQNARPLDRELSDRLQSWYRLARVDLGCMY
jgi:hypothetical protein